MIHTFLLTCPLTRAMWQQMQEKFKAYFGSRPTVNPLDGSLEFGTFSTAKFKPYMKPYTVSGIKKWYLNLKVNPAAILYDDYIGLSDEEDIMKATELIQDFLDDTDVGLTIEDFNLNRIDYAVNLSLPNDRIKLAYLKLMKRGWMPVGFSYVTEFSPTQHRRIPYKSSFYCTSDVATINFYGKYEQLQSCASFIDPSRAKRLLRLEVQCRRKKLESLKRSHRMSDDDIDRIISNGMSLEVIKYYLNQIFPRGDFFTLQEARSLILKSNHIDRVKTDMISFMKLVAVYRSLPKAVAVFGNSASMNLIHHFDTLGVNPITLPLNWNIEFLENPVELLPFSEK